MCNFITFLKLYSSIFRANGLTIYNVIYCLKNENLKLKNYIEKTFEYVSLLFNFSKERLKRLVNSFIDKLNINEKER